MAKVKKVNKVRKVSSNTGYKGISLRKDGYYEVRLSVNAGSKSTNFYVGVAATLDEAITKRQKFIVELL